MARYQLPYKVPINFDYTPYNFDTSTGPKASYLSGHHDPQAWRDLLLFYYDSWTPMCIHASAFMVDRFFPEGIVAATPDPSDPWHIFWHDWGLRNTFTLPSYSELFDNPILGASGRRIVLADKILDFNCYDIAHNLYGRSGRRDTHGVSGEAPGDSDEYPEDSSELVKLPVRSDHEHGVPLKDAFRGSMPCRSTPLNLGFSGHTGKLHLIEEKDGPKVSLLLAMPGVGLRLP